MPNYNNEYLNIVNNMNGYAYNECNGNAKKWADFAFNERKINSRIKKEIFDTITLRNEIAHGYGNVIVISKKELDQANTLLNLMKSIKVSEKIIDKKRNNDVKENIYSLRQLTINDLNKKSKELINKYKGSNIEDDLKNIFPKFIFEISYVTNYEDYQSIMKSYNSKINQILGNFDDELEDNRKESIKAVERICKTYANTWSHLNDELADEIRNMKKEALNDVLISKDSSELLYAVRKYEVKCIHIAFDDDYDLEDEIINFEEYYLTDEDN